MVNTTSPDILYKFKTFSRNFPSLNGRNFLHGSRWLLCTKELKISSVYSSNPYSIYNIIIGISPALQHGVHYACGWVMNIFAHFWYKFLMQLSNPVCMLETPYPGKSLKGASLLNLQKFTLNLFIVTCTYMEHVNILHCIIYILNHVLM